MKAEEKMMLKMVLKPLPGISENKPAGNGWLVGYFFMA